MSSISSSFVATTVSTPLASAVLFTGEFTELPVFYSNSNGKLNSM